MRVYVQMQKKSECTAPWRKIWKLTLESLKEFNSWDLSVIRYRSWNNLNKVISPSSHYPFPRWQNLLRWHSSKEEPPHSFRSCELKDFGRRLAFSHHLQLWQAKPRASSLSCWLNTSWIPAAPRKCHFKIIERCKMQHRFSVTTLNVLGFKPAL